MCRIQYLLLGDAQEGTLHGLNLRHMRDDRNLAECIGQRVRQTVKASNHRRQDKILTVE
jgi:hypothetical protein